MRGIDRFGEEIVGDAPARRADGIRMPQHAGRRVVVAQHQRTKCSRDADLFGADRFTIAGLGEDVATGVGLDYRRIVLKELGQLPWSADVVDGVDAATALARSSPLLNQPLDSEAPWLNWIRPRRDIPRD